MLPTCAISFLPAVGTLIFFSSSTTTATALSMPRLSAIGLTPAVTFLSPSRKIACASTVAVVVPSPARSDVLVATSFTICAPMFSSGSDSSISFATVTPSLVTVGAPNFLSMTTFRPLGPSVTLTASASWSTPRLSAARASVLKYSSLLAIGQLPVVVLVGVHERDETTGPRCADHAYPITASTSDSRRMSTWSPSSVTSVPLYFPYSTLSPTFTSGGIRLPSS